MSRNSIKYSKKTKRVFKGIIFDVWQWKQKMFDGSYEIFEKLTRPDTVNVIAVTRNKILVLEQKQPHWEKYRRTLAGGRIDAGEMPLEAAKRELLEETGYSSKKWVLWSKINPYSKIEWTVYNYIARDCVKLNEPKLDPGEKITFKPVSFKEFLELSEEPSFYEGELKNFLIRAKYDRKYKEIFRKLIFGDK